MVFILFTILEIVIFYGVNRVDDDDAVDVHSAVATDVEGFGGADHVHDLGIIDGVAGFAGVCGGYDVDGVSAAERVRGAVGGVGARTSDGFSGFHYLDGVGALDGSSILVVLVLS